MQDSKFYTKAGWLTPYALACGYIEKHDFPQEGGEISLTLWHEGGTVYHVRAHDHKEGKRLFWDCFEKLTEARKRYLMAIEEISDAQEQAKRDAADSMGDLLKSLEH